MVFMIQHPSCTQHFHPNLQRQYVKEAKTMWELVDYNRVVGHGFFLIDMFGTIYRVGTITNCCGPYTTHGMAVSSPAPLAITMYDVGQGKCTKIYSASISENPENETMIPNAKANNTKELYQRPIQYMYQRPVQ